MAAVWPNVHAGRRVTDALFANLRRQRRRIVADQELRRLRCGPADRRAARAETRPRRTGRSKRRPRRRPRCGAALLRSPAGSDDRGQEIARLRVEQRIVGQRAGRDDPRHLALHQPLGQLRVFDLLANRGAVAGRDDLRQVRIELMVRKPGHRHRVVALVAAGEREAQHAGGRLRVVEEQLVEVAHAKQQQRIAGGPLGLVVLLHHGREAGMDDATPAWSRSMLAESRVESRGSRVREPEADYAWLSTLDSQLSTSLLHQLFLLVDRVEIDLAAVFERRMTSTISCCLASTTDRLAGPRYSISSRSVSAARSDMFLRIFSLSASLAPLRAIAHWLVSTFLSTVWMSLSVNRRDVLEDEHQAANFLDQLRILLRQALHAASAPSRGRRR